MGVINFLKTNCENCYSCVRACSVNAIKVINSQAEIIEERCIACGKCIEACPKNAKEVKSDKDKLYSYINNKDILVASVAPSFVGAFGENSMRLASMLRSLGFSYIEETAIGAEIVNDAYEEYAKKLDHNCYITSCCASLNDLIQKHYPDLIKNLIPVLTPLQCHSRILKNKYGENSKVIFIGPCIAKKNEGEKDKFIDAVLTFEELMDIFEEKNITAKNIEESQFDDISYTQRTYPILGGITSKMDKNEVKRELLHVDGIEECLQVLEQIKCGRFKDTFIEMNLCRNGCINGPGIKEDGLIPYERRQLVKRFSKLLRGKTPEVFHKGEIYNINLKKEFQSKYKALSIPSEEEIKEILRAIGKYTIKDEINCGTCGYKTCREKAIAVYNGMAELNMCMPYMKQKAENLSNVIFDITPTIILVLNSELEIVDFNPSAEKFFKMKKVGAVGLDIGMLTDKFIIEEFINSESKMISKKAFLKEQGATVLFNLIKMDSNSGILVVINDFTETLKQEEELQEMKINAIDMAQHVIDKQMRVAQEIASLLGETTAETKVYLTKLKKIVQGEGRE